MFRPMFSSAVTWIWSGKRTSLEAVLVCLILTCSLLGLVGCKTSSRQAVSTSLSGQTGPPSADPDDLMIVDCLLPGQVRKLGQHMTYLSPRRPIRTTALECQIRGGEYVAYDRANFETALQVWLMQAEQGDPKAQNYVGTIYQKGMGVSPNYTKAAEWYAKAAKQGYIRAQVNLGYLYEQGLGVKKDPQKSLEWYSRASGLPEGIEIVDPEQEKVRKEEMAELRSEVKHWKSEAQRLQKAFHQNRRELEYTRSVLSKRQQEVQAAYERLNQARNRLEQARRESSEDIPSPAQDDSQVRALQKQLVRSQKELSTLHSELKASRKSEDQVQQRLKNREEQIENVHKELIDLRSKLAALQNKHLSSNDHVEGLEQELKTREDALASARAEVQKLRDEVQASQQSEQEYRSLLTKREENMDEAYRRLQQTRQNLEELKKNLVRRHEAEVQSAQEQIDLRENELQQYKMDFAALKQEARALQEDKAQLRAKLSSKEQELQAALHRVQEQETELQDLRQDTQSQRSADIARLEAEIQNAQQELQAKNAAISQLEAKVEDLHSKADQYQQELKKVQQTGSETTLQGPRIEIIEPPLVMSKTRGVQIVEVRYGVVDREIIGKVYAPAGLLTLKINGRKQRVEKTGLFRSRIPVLRSNRNVRVVAVDKQGQRAVTEFIMTSDQAGEAKAGSTAQKTESGREKTDFFDIDFGRFYALIIGNSNYTHLPKLQSAHNDAREVASLLKSKYGFQTTLLLDASRYDILSALNVLREKLTEKDNLLIYYAGHGELDKVNMRGYWLPINAEQDSTANWISNISLTDILNIMSAKQILVVADSCYSGIMTRSALTRLASGKSAQAKKQWLERMANLRARMVLTSGGLKPVLDAGGGGHSVFARAFLDVLQDNQVILEGQALYREVSSRVSFAVSTIGMEQLPEYAPLKFAGHETGDFFFIPINPKTL